MLLELTDQGLYCPAGDFYIDPWQAVNCAIVTHAHSDHAYRGSHRYLTCRQGSLILRTRLGDEAQIQTVEYGEGIDLGGVRVSLHPAGHILGSAQVRVEHQGEVWVVSGDYKLDSDPTCSPFEPLRCHTFITEATFGLPIYRWPAQSEIFTTVHKWWQTNQEEGKASLLFAYSLGKAQRLLAGLNSSIGPIFTHGAVENLNQAYRASGVSLPATTFVGAAAKNMNWSQALILAPPSAQGTPWMRKLGDLSTAFASGWMQIRGARRRRSIDHGFILSDHADWPGLLSAIQATGAERVWVTHGYTSVVARWLQEKGLEAQPLQTQFAGETDEANEISAPLPQESSFPSGEENL
jgi:putative mRNA 3-end processing factor